jgi:cysteine desulfurase/selenocysteine lyase
MTWHKDFPVLVKNEKNTRPLCFLDTAASAQKPQVVIDAISHFYANDYANIHRGIYDLSAKATDLYESVREKVASFLSASSPDEIVFVRGATEAINLVAESLAQGYFSAGDEVILTEMEHHANIVPWQRITERLGLKLQIVPLLDDGTLDMVAWARCLSSRTKLVALTHVSNVLGTINPIADMIAEAHQHGARVLIDGAQAVSHLRVNVSELDADYYVFSAHKCYGPTGAGVLYGKKAWLNTMAPYQSGGGMISEVSMQASTYLPAPQRFEAGTPDIAAVIGMGAALDYLSAQDWAAVKRYEASLEALLHEGLLTVPGIRVLGEAKQRIGVYSFVHDAVHAHDLGTLLNEDNVAVRVGHHCAMPLHDRFGVAATVRASLGLYNTEADVQRLIDSLKSAIAFFKG